MPAEERFTHGGVSHYPARTRARAGRFRAWSTSGVRPRQSGRSAYRRSFFGGSRVGPRLPPGPDRAAPSARPSARSPPDRALQAASAPADRDSGGENREGGLSLPLGLRGKPLTGNPPRVVCGRRPRTAGIGRDQRFRGRACPPGRRAYASALPLSRAYGMRPPVTPRGCSVSLRVLPAARASNALPSSARTRRGRCPTYSRTSPVGC